MNMDAQIHEEVVRELNRDARLEHAYVDVRVEKGVVLLQGGVSTHLERTAALEAAHRVTGVLDVVNDINVCSRGPTVPTDLEIARAVRNALEWDVRVPDARTIRSTVADGWVTLEGEVGAWYEREAAEHCLSHLAGVRGVINTIDVSVPYVKTETIRHEIEQALERRAVREARHIEIDMRNGVVTLTGTVQSCAEREAVLGAARCTPGVREVQDRLRSPQTGTIPPTTGAQLTP